MPYALSIYDMIPLSMESNALENSTKILKSLIIESHIFIFDSYIYMYVCLNEYIYVWI